MYFGGLWVQELFEMTKFQVPKLNTATDPPHLECSISSIQNLHDYLILISLKFFHPLTFLRGNLGLQKNFIYLISITCG